MGKIKEFLKKIRDYSYRNFITEYFIPVKEQILLQSKPDFSDNTYAIYKELIKNDYQKKYKIIWFVSNDEIDSKFKRDDVYYFNEAKKGLLNRIKKEYIINTSKFIITCNGFYQRKTKRQTIIYLNHGMPIKDCTKLKMKFGCVDLSLTTSEYFIENLSQSLMTDKNKFKKFQFPRNDELFQNTKNVKEILNLSNQKLIVWMPTFRVYEDGKRVDSNFDMPLGLPIVYKKAELEKLNKYLKENNITLILKPHFASKAGLLKADNYSNFIVLTNKDLENYNLTLYELLSGTDALITDYSSVYYDYLLIDKPIALTLDDFEVYKRDTGLAVDYFEIIKGHYVYNMVDLYHFIDNIISNNDEFKNERLSVIKTLGYDRFQKNYTKTLFEYIQKKYKM